MDEYSKLVTTANRLLVQREELQKVNEAARRLITYRDQLYDVLVSARAAGVPLTKLSAVSGIAQGHMTDICKGNKPITFLVAQRLADMEESR